MPHGQEPWRVRVCDAEGAVLGAGMVLCTGHVLTCAHVLMGHRSYAPAAERAVPDVKVTVNFVGLHGVPSARAWVADGGWIPPLRDGRGDVALLELDRPQPGGLETPLHRLPVTWGRAVHTCGFPRHLENGLWVGATLAGSCGPGGEWVQLNPRSAGEQVRAGFSGAAVVDDETGYVIGMLVSKFTNAEADLSWMIPVETIVRHIPRVTECVSGAKAADQSFAEGLRQPGILDVDLARQIAIWLGQRHGTASIMIVIGTSNQAVLAVLRRAIVLADRELRPPATDEILTRAPAGTVPPLGSVDLAVDAAGKTVGEVFRRIVDRTGIPVDESTEPTVPLRDDVAPMTVVVDGIDDAEQPEALLTEVLKPLSEQGTRLLLGFRRESSPSLSIAQSLTANDAPLGDEEIQERLEQLARQVIELSAVEREARRRHEYVAGRITLVPAAPSRAVSLRLSLSALRLAAADPDRHWLRSELEATERAAERALGQATEIRQRLDELLAKRQELRGRLEAFKAKAADGGLAEDIQLATLYRQAHEMLWRAPCDLLVATESVERYLQAVRHKLDGRSGDGAP